MESVEAILENRDFIRTLARSLVNDTDLADEVVQKTWIAAWKSGKVPAALTRSWFAKVVKNFAVEEIRAGRARVTRERKTAPSVVIGETAVSVAEEEETRRKVIDAVLELDEPERTVILLYYYRELKLKNISDELGRPIPTVKDCKRNGLVKLRRKLDREFGDRKSWCMALLPMAALCKPTFGTTGAAAALKGTVASLQTANGALKSVLAIATVCLVGTILYMIQPPDESRFLMPVGTGGAGTEAAASLPSADVLDNPPAELVPVTVDPRTPPSEKAGSRETGLRVLVTHRGQPVPNATVGLIPSNWIAQHKTIALHQGRREEYRYLSRGVTDRKGLFILSAGGGEENSRNRIADLPGEGTGDLPIRCSDGERGSGWYSIRVEAEGYATTFSRPTLIVPGTSPDDIRIELSLGGAVAGVVRVESAVSTSGWIVTAQKADHVLVTATGPAGEYRFDRLTPGRWDVIIIPDFDRRSVQPVDLTDAPTSIKLLCTVYEGMTTRGDIDEKVLPTGRSSACVDPFDLEGPARIEDSKVKKCKPVAPLEREVGSMRTIGTGWITAGGEPVQNALVSLVPLTEEGDYCLTVHGFPSRMGRYFVSRDETDQDGFFELVEWCGEDGLLERGHKYRLLGRWSVPWAHSDWILSPGRFCLRVEADGFAATILPPVEIDPEIGLAGTRIELHRGGSIVGTVAVAPGASKEGIVVGASCGDGRPFTVRTDGSGEYRFDHLTSGRWQVAICDDLLGERPDQIGLEEPLSQIDWDCTVSEGKTTRHDLDGTIPRKAILIASIDPVIAGGIARLYGRHNVPEEIPVDRSGVFKFVNKVPEKVRLKYTSAEVPGYEISIQRTLVAGSNFFTFQPESGYGSLDVIVSEDRDTILVYRHVSRDGMLKTTVPIRPDASGRACLKTVPAGVGRVIERMTGTVLSVVDVPVGGWVTVPIDH